MAKKNVVNYWMIELLHIMLIQRSNGTQNTVSNFFVVGWGQPKSQTLLWSQTKQLLSKGHVTLVAWQGLKESLLKSRGRSCQLTQNLFTNACLWRRSLMPREGTPCIEHILQSYHALFIKYIIKVLWCCHTFALDSMIKTNTGRILTTWRQSPRRQSLLSREFD